MRLTCAVVAVVVCLAGPAQAERPKKGDRQPPAGKAPKAERPKIDHSKAEHPKAGAARANQAPVEQWGKMTPEQRRQEMSKLPPERQRRIQEQTERLKQMSPQERAKVGGMYGAFQKLTPKEQAAIRNSADKLDHMPVDRQTVVRREYDELSRMPPAERKARLESDAFKRGYDKQERQILEDLSKVIPDRQ